MKIGRAGFVSFQIGVKPTAKNVGGISIFGRKFGNYAQNIMIAVDYDGLKKG